MALPEYGLPGMKKALRVNLSREWCWKERPDMLKTPAKPKHCPWCNSNLVAEIIHEINSLSPAIEQDLNDRKAVLGVNLKGRANPKWQCMDCGAQIYGPDRASPPETETSVTLPTDLGSWIPFNAKPDRKGN